MNTTAVKRTGWEHQQLESEMRNANFPQLLALYTRENDRHKKLCIVMYNSVGKVPPVSEERRNELINDAELANEARQKVALAIANRLVGTH